MREQRAALAPIIALAVGLLASVTIISLTIYSPATIPLWCAAHGGCP